MVNLSPLDLLILQTDSLPILISMNLPYLKKPKSNLLMELKLFNLNQ